jgi:hypothetical protein
VHDGAQVGIAGQFESGVEKRQLCRHQRIDRLGRQTFLPIWSGAFEAVERMRPAPFTLADTSPAASAPARRKFGKVADPHRFEAADHRTAARNDVDQVASFDDQQRFPHRAARNAEVFRHFQFLNPLERAQAAR